MENSDLLFNSVGGVARVKTVGVKTARLVLNVDCDHVGLSMMWFTSLTDEASAEH